MAIKPILFNTAMSRAILDGRKTTTRRAVKRRYSNTEIEIYTNKYGTRLVERQNDAPAPEIYFDENGVKHTRRHLVACQECKSPYSVGDILWVRETFFCEECNSRCAGHIDIDECIFNLVGNFCIGYKTQYIDSTGNGVKWRPSIHMPKKAARTFLRVTGVRVERVQDITVHQCIKEGVEKEALEVGAEFVRGMFHNIWDRTIKKADLQRYGWNSNPWVWGIEFERCEKPEGF